MHVSCVYLCVQNKCAMDSFCGFGTGIFGMKDEEIAINEKLIRCAVTFTIIILIIIV